MPAACSKSSASVPAMASRSAVALRVTPARVVHAQRRAWLRPCAGGRVGRAGQRRGRRDHRGMDRRKREQRRLRRRAPARDGDWLAIGALVAAKPTWPAAWSLGVIRRLSTDDTGRRASACRFSRVAALRWSCCRCRSGDSGRPRPAYSSPAGTQTSLNGGEVTLVVAHGALAWSLSYAMRIHERSYSVNPRRVVESGDDFDVVSFAISA